MPCLAESWRMNWIVWLYQLVFPLALLLAAPWWLLRMATTARYREGLTERLGWVPRRLHLHGDEREVIWVHAVSVGEVIAVLRLIAALDQQRPQARVLLSTTTRTGQQIARARLGTERVFYCPLDLGWATRAWLRALRPSLLVLVETEFWPSLLSGCFRRGIPVMVVNARISDRSWPRYHRLRALWRPFLRRLSAVLAQSEQDALRLRALGCVAAEVAGNLKYDLKADADAEVVALLRTWKSSAGKSSGGKLSTTNPNRRWLVAGSTVDGEEQAILAAWPRLRAAHGDLLLLLAPRHPERFTAVARLLEESGIPWLRRSQLTSAEQLHDEVEILLLDTIGELASAYSLAEVAFVGGSVARAGGHNPLEPALHEVPVVMGPHVENFRGIVADMQAENAIVITQTADFDAVSEALLHLLTDRAAARAIGERARSVLARHSGATQRALRAIDKVMQAKGKAQP